LALKDKEDVVRKKAAVALGEMRSVEALPALTNALEDNCPKVRAAAAEALRMTTYVYPPAVKLALTRALKDTDPGVRYAVGEALLSESILSDNGDFLPSPTLIRAALKHNDPEVRKAAAEALGRSRDISVVLTLAKAATDESPEVRKAAIRSLAEFGEYASPATPALIRTLRDPNEGVRIASSGVLCAVGKASAVPALIQALKDKNRDVRKNAAKALGIFRASTAIPSLLQILKNGDKLDRQYGVDWDAAHAISNMGKHGMWVLIRALESNNMRTRYVAAEALGRLGKNATPAIPYLDRAAKDGNILVKTHVEWALITIKNGTESWYKGEEKWESRHGYCTTGTKQEYAHTP
jgi:HEAT repeat protein